MLQRAASNAYSWWWASHVRTKQSKWLEQNLQDMEEKVQCMLKLIEEDGDSFAKRAEMYYRRRPELINFVEESYRAYRALAERYDHISGELQNANHTIATVFPEQVQLAMEAEEDCGSQKIPARSINPSKLPTRLPEVPKANIPEVPKILNKTIKGSPKSPIKELQPKKPKTTNITGSSQMSKVEAIEEIDKLQKGILALQTEKEFIKSSYESKLAKYWEIEKSITEMQEKVSGLHDEFSVGSVIEDDDARTLMASTALKSCQETLIQLQEKQERSVEEATVEYQRIKHAHEKLEALKDEFIRNGKNCQNLPEKEFMDAGQILENTEQCSSLQQERLQSELLREKIKEHFEMNSNSSLTVMELAEKIDELVIKVIGLETAISSQTVLITTLRSENDELQAHLQSLEEDKTTMIKDSNNLNEKLRELEVELHVIQGLNRNVEDQNSNLQTHFTEAHCNLDHLSEKLQCMKKLDEEINIKDPVHAEVNILLNPKQKEFEEQEDMVTPSDDILNKENKITERRENIDEIPGSSLHVKDQEGLAQPKSSSDLHDLSEKIQGPKQQDEAEIQDLTQTERSVLAFEPEEHSMDQDLPNWNQLLSNGSEDREKILLAEYTSILWKYKDAKKKLSEEDKKNRDSLFETKVQIRELKSSNAMKDNEIQSLQQKLIFLQTSSDENIHLTEFEDSQKGRPHNHVVDGSTSQSCNIQSVNLENHDEATERPDESTADGAVEISPAEDKGEIKATPTNESHTVSTTEEKFRRDIDDLLEENLKFWLRFSTSFHQIQKFQTAIQDLQVEFSKLKENKKEGSNITTHQSLRSDALPIYKHLKEIQTELTVWLEQNMLLKDELQGRLSSLCKIQEEISRVSKAGNITEDVEFTSYRAAKFQGEVLNMQQENNKVADELQTGLDHVKGLQIETEKTLLKMNEDLKLSESKSHHPHMKHSTSRTRVPLRSFIFGVKAKKHKPSIFSCMSPALHKQYSDLNSNRPI